MLCENMSKDIYTTRKMITGKSQATVEFMIILSAVGLLLVSLTFLNLKFLTTANETRNLIKGILIANTISNAINYIYLSGENTEKIIDLRDIITVNNVRILIVNDGVITYANIPGKNPTGIFRPFIADNVSICEFNASKIKIKNSGGQIQFEILE